ncbi:MAG TPA: glycosyltransferase family 1 protein [Isosphaeraceae bacterium]|jgi:glycosyltransferase involved in cell wall biosynthesis|nr:glycosyltransferase family 1 protein [Isosphaeraceae bacterium]
MRVTLVTETFAPQVNGVSRTLGELARVLTAAGDVVQVVHPDYGTPPAAEHHRLVRAVSLPFYKELRLPLPPFGSTRRALDAFAPDLVHVATEATLGLSLLRHALRRKLPVVSSFHTNFDQYSSHYRVGWTRGTIWRYLRWFHNKTIETYVPSPTTLHDLRDRGFERLVLWPRGVDAATFRPDRPGRKAVRAALGFGPDDVVIGHVSRIAAEKNIGYLGAALAAVVAERPAARLLIVGDGPALPDLRRQLGESARFVGYKTGDDLADHYAAADLFAFASLTETFGNVVLEAMASGLPVVAVRAGGPGDTVRPGQNGELVEPAEPPATFAATLVALIDDRDRRRRLADGARAFAASQTWDAIHGALRRRYLTILGDSSTIFAPAEPERSRVAGS